MAVLHVKTPNGDQSDVDLDKIVMTEGDQTISGIKILDRIKFSPFGEIGSRLTDHVDEEKIHHQLLIGANSIVDAWTSGAGIVLNPYEEGVSENNGTFYLCPADIGYRDGGLLGYPDGRLLYRGIRLDRDSQGDNYIRYNNGIQICWGRFDGTQTVYFTITYPMPFKDWPYTALNNGACNMAEWHAEYCTLGFAREQTYISSTTKPWINYIAIGYWK